MYLFKCGLGTLSLETWMGVKETSRKVRRLACNRDSDAVRKRTQHLLLLKIFLPHKLPFHMKNDSERKQALRSREVSAIRKMGRKMV